MTTANIIDIICHMGFTIQLKLEVNRELQQLLVLPPLKNISRFKTILGVESSLILHYMKGLPLFKSKPVPLLLSCAPLLYNLPGKLQ